MNVEGLYRAEQEACREFVTEVVAPNIRCRVYYKTPVRGCCA